MSIPVLHKNPEFKPGSLTCKSSNYSNAGNANVSPKAMTRLPFPPSFCTQISSSNSVSSLESLKSVHARIIIHGLSDHLSFLSNLLSLAVSLSSSMDYAHKLFDTMPQRDSFVFNTLIRGYTDKGPCNEALIIYKHMHSNDLYPDHYAFPFLLRACGTILAVKEGKMAHCNVIKHGFNANHFVQTALVAMYSHTGEIYDSELVFHEMKLKNLVSWTAMISGYSQNCFHKKALHIFSQMVASGTQPNEITLTSVLPSLRGPEYMNLGKLIHGFSIKFGMVAFERLLNALVAMYGKCGCIKLARYLFDELPARSLVSWNTMIAMYEQNNEANKSVTLFREMSREKVKFNCVTLVSVLSACANLGSLETGKWVHELARNNGLDSDFRVRNILIDMYAKCGRIDYAREMFDEVPQRGVISYTSMINALANHDEPKKALNLFSLMKKEGIKPNSYTFTAVLLACAHSGLINQALNHFVSMRKEYKISPTLEHYTCIVDMLGREGNILEAYDFIKNMDIKPDRGIWGALLGACRIHGRLDFSEYVARDIFKLGYNDFTFYMLLTNIYGDAKRWRDVERLRKIMRELDLKKNPGLSLICFE